MERYEQAEIEVIVFEISDVVTESKDDIETPDIP